GNEAAGEGRAHRREGGPGERSRGDPAKEATEGGGGADRGGAHHHAAAHHDRTGGHARADRDADRQGGPGERGRR
ncbi:hypothetical protein C3R30_21295, partial [Mycobacterium tuberculosis]